MKKKACFWVVATWFLAIVVSVEAAVVNTWARTADSDALASNPANWSLRHAPLSNEIVRLPQSCSRAMIWDEKATDVVSGWIQEDGFIAVVTVNTTPKAGGFTTLKVLGDFDVRGGAVTHPANDDAEAWWLSLDIAGDLLLGEKAYFSVSGKGYASGKGPSPGVTFGSGASHGGQGAPQLNSANERPARTYDSIINPVMSGSGGTTREGAVHSYNGGGVIVLKVGGQVRVNGTITANADGRDIDDSNIGGAAGGSVNIRAELDITGEGSISANGGRGFHEGGGGGGGGRVALVSKSGSVRLPQARIAAYGACGESANPDNPIADRHIRGAAGTVYLESRSDEALNGGEVNVRDWHRPSLASTRIPSDMHPDVGECKDAALVVDGNGFVVVTASTSLRKLTFGGGGMDLNKNTLSVGSVINRKKEREPLDASGTYTSPTVMQLDSVIFSGGRIIVRTYFKPIL